MSLATTLLSLLLGIGVFISLALIAGWRSRNRRVVCPETRRPLLVAVDDADEASFAAGRHLRVIDCDRWPEKADCDRDCEHAL